ncbi:hypothetical protein KH5H1_64840 [Corallococcus caeni]|nr:hypothetical protein KH5H1_64840 [Corallococcus sp. KH5-1]
MNSALATAMEASRVPREEDVWEGPVEAVAVETDTFFSMRTRHGACHARVKAAPSIAEVRVLPARSDEGFR